ncbi:uncharacterized protein LOC143024266 [Oratosquilla oratoria]|uniref:uncharacterized protein LOC143024266 n=1 Tax=Oratosquilla oratoria TaxID=337810 RepID=UPI003F76F2C7
MSLQYQSSTLQNRRRPDPFWRSFSNSSSVIFVLLLAISCCTSFVSARMAYQFSAGSESITGPVSATFTCDGRPYGYYADVDNGCRIFHICQPIPDDAGSIIEYAHYSFACGNQTVFNQETLTCDHPEFAFPCDQAESLYDLKNSEFGRIIDNNNI